MDDELADKAQDHFEMFYEEVFEELANYGQIEEMVVCDNIGKSRLLECFLAAVYLYVVEASCEPVT